MIKFNIKLFDIIFITPIDINIHEKYIKEKIIKAIPLSYEQKYINLRNKLKYLY